LSVANPDLRAGVIGGQDFAGQRPPAVELKRVRDGGDSAEPQPQANENDFSHG